MLLYHTVLFFPLFTTTTVVTLVLAASKEFIEQRRRALKRCLNQIARHPTLCEDRIVVFFLTVKTSVCPGCFFVKGSFYVQGILC